MESQPGTSDGDRTVIDRIVWVAYDAGVSVGLIDVESYNDATAGFAVVVAPEHRRRGLGRRIIRSVIEQPRHAAVAIWKAGVEPANEASARCLAAAGFTPRTATPDHEGMLNYQRRT
jgi:L-amino acid N-acyltransferase YncA